MTLMSTVFTSTAHLGLRDLEVCYVRYRQSDGGASLAIYWV